MRSDTPPRGIVEGFVGVRGNGSFEEPGTVDPSIPLMEQVTNPAYQLVGYRWCHAGTEHRLSSNGSSVTSAVLLPDASGIGVLESHALSAPDNLRILWPDGSLRQRLRNPYLDTAEYRVGDELCFCGVDARNGNLYAQVSVIRRAGYGDHPAMPLYDVMWEPATLTVVSFEWRPWD